MRTSLLITIAAVLLAACKGQPTGPADGHSFSQSKVAALDSLFHAQVEARKIPGAVVLVATDEGMLYHKAFGFRDREARAPQQTSDLFRIASMTKPITAVAAMMMFEEGKFALDDPVAQFIPEFKNPVILDNVRMEDSTFSGYPATEAITVRHLFTHTSGIGYGFQDEKLMALFEKEGITEGFETHDILLADNVKKIARMPLMHEPGTQFTYGLNSDVLGRLVEIWSGMPLDEYFQKEIFDPLGMVDTHFYLPENKYDRLARVYMSSNSGAIPTDYPLIDYPVKGAKRYLSGGADLSSSANDYYLFCRMLLNGGVVNGLRLLQPETVDMITSTQFEMGDEDMGLGVSILSAKTDTDQARSVGSFSGGGFFTTSFWVDPQEKIIAILFLQMYPFEDWDLQKTFEDIIYR